MSYPSRVFDGFNPAGPPCPICRTKADTKTILVPIPGTWQDGLQECRQTHTACWDLVQMMAALEGK